MKKDHFHYGFSLLELLVAMASASVLLAGLGSALYVAGQVAATPAPTRAVLEEAEAMERITADLENATYLRERTDRTIEALVADWDGDGRDDVIRYQWSGTPGDPLQRRINGGPLQTILPHVAAFSLGYRVERQDEQLLRTQDSAEQKLDEFSGYIISGQTTVVSNTHWVGQYLHPRYFSTGLPDNTLSWTPTRVDIYAKHQGSKDATLRVQLRPAGDDGRESAPSGQPTSQVLDEATIAEANLPSSFGWCSLAMARPLGLSPRGGLCLTVAGSTTDSAQLRYDNFWFYDTACQRLDTDNAGASWTSPPYEGLRYRLYGTYRTAICDSGGQPLYQTARRSFCTAVDLSIQTESGRPAVTTGISLRNCPEALSARWKLDFDADPTDATTVDANGDRAADWTRRDGAPFNRSALVGGQWTVDAPLDTAPACDFTRPTVVELTVRGTATSGTGEVFRINADWSGNTAIPLYVAILTSDGSQAVSVGRLTAASTLTPWCTLARLPDAAIGVRLAIDPTANNVAVWVEGAYQGLFAYTPIAMSDTRHAATLQPGGRFDHVSIRVGTE